LVVDGYNRSLFNEVFAYLEGRSAILDPRKGLLLTGPIGSGKTTLIRAVAFYQKLALGLKDGRCEGGFRIDSASYVAMLFMTGGYTALQPYTYNEDKSAYTVCFDELGREPLPVKYFGSELNVMQYILQCRYESIADCLTHVTTNLSVEELEERYGDYIADRINEMFNVCQLNGASRR
jgi:hypothetical protein